MIETVGLTKSFRIKNKTVDAVRGVSLTVKKGEIFGFLGPNGAGKTTCQRMLTTLLPIGGGTARVAGFDAAGKPGEVRKRIGYVSQLGGADLEATGRENLTLAARLYGAGKAEAKNKIAELAGLLEISELLDRIVKTYSGGQKRRLEVALSIVHEPEILFMDEPTTGLDPQNRANLWTHIQELAKNGMTVFLTTHYLDEADALAGRIAIIDLGKIVAEGTPTELKKRVSGDVIRLRLQNAAGVGALFSNMDFINETRGAGNDLFLYVKDGAKALPVIFDALKANNIVIDNVTLSAPSLDDVFLKETGRSLRDVREAGDGGSNGGAL